MGSHHWLLDNLLYIYKLICSSETVWKQGFNLVKRFHSYPYHSLGQFSRLQIDDIFLIFFPRKKDLTFHANCLQTICMICQSLFPGKNKKKNSSICHLLKILPRVLSIQVKIICWRTRTKAVRESDYSFISFCVFLFGLQKYHRVFSP